jgi:formate hydrogenlyase subunit 3/multisubunit Na+/H+ antiporter MnhD subunit
MEPKPNASPPPSPPVGWALTHDLPPGYTKKKPRPGGSLWIVFLILTVIGSSLSIVGLWVRSQADSWTAAAPNPVAQFHSGEVISAIGSVFFVAAFVVAVVSIASGFPWKRETSATAAPASQSNEV